MLLRVALGSPKLSAAVHGRKPVCRVRRTVPNSATLLFLVAGLAIPGFSSAQTAIAPAPPSESPAPLRLFKDAPREPGADWIGSPENPQNLNWWQLPASGSEVPRWSVGHSVTLNTPGGLAWSAGLFGRRGDPLPMYLSEQTQQRAASNAITGPGMYRLQWDAKFGVSAPVWTGRRVKIRAVGELFVPLTRPLDPADPSATLLNSRTLRFGLVTVF